MSDQDELREALMKIGTNGWSREHIMDAVLNILDQQDWMSPEDYAVALAASERISAEVLEAATFQIKAERDTALREAARYEQVLAAWIKRQRDGWEPEIEHGQWVIERWRRTGMSSGDTFEGYETEPMTEAEQEVMASLYRRVTEGEEG